MLTSWNYLIITASNEAQAAGYRAQLELRAKLGLLADVKNTLVVADPDGKRIGSGGSTLCCLMEVLSRELGDDIAGSGQEQWQQVLSRLRILIIHAGGDSKRLPAYGACGKIFVPVPGESDSCLPVTLFDRQIPTYLALPAPSSDAGQVVITSGDVMLRFDPQQIDFSRLGLTGLGCFAPPEQSQNHGVYCGTNNGQVLKFLQKPTPTQQKELGATDHYGQSILDIGVMSFDAQTAVDLLNIFNVLPDPESENTFSLQGDMGRAVMQDGLDFYREICCGMGADATVGHYIQTVGASGSAWSDALLGRLFQALRSVPFNLELLRQCDFIDFGTSRQIIYSGTSLLQHDRGGGRLSTSLDINNTISGKGSLTGNNAWVEGCRLMAPLTCEGENLVLGIDLNEPLTIPFGACLDVLKGTELQSESTWFVRCYHVNDTFKKTVEQGATFCGQPILQWLAAAGVTPQDVWLDEIPEQSRTLWDAQMFPRINNPRAYRDWLWMFDPEQADPQQQQQWRNSPRYSLAQIAHLADNSSFFDRRLSIRTQQVRDSLRQMFRRESEFSAAEIAFLLEHTPDPAEFIVALISEARWYHENIQGLDRLTLARLMHSLASALTQLAQSSGYDLGTLMTKVVQTCSPSDSDWLERVGLSFDIETANDSAASLSRWCRRAKSLSFESLSRTIMSSTEPATSIPQNALRPDEIVWGRAPARFDTGGGWTDTPPYSLEYGGSVVNAAVDLNGQPPIQVYAKVTKDPVIVIGSIDLGTRIRICGLDGLLDYRDPASQYGLVKAALALSGFSPESAPWPDNITLPDMLKQFGGGIEITTLAAIPKGSGLGTSSILGAATLAVISTMMGRTLTQQELFNQVLQLEQALTTGGGWQDQVGGVVGGTKIVHAEPGLVPQVRVHYLPADLLDPSQNEGTTLLYYTGITRLAKNILEQVVGQYLDRDREGLNTQKKIHRLSSVVAEALSRKDAVAFGHLINTAWCLNKQLDPNSTNEQVELLMERIQPYVFGAKLLGAGGGGFVLMVAKSSQDALKIRQMLNADPPNDRARFFDYSINHEGLVVTVC